MIINTQTKPSYLTIQKAVKLLSALHLDAFKSYLKSINASMPLKLVTMIEPGFEDKTSSDELCKKVYGEADLATKKRFNQLASYTFKLYAFVSRNFPNHLHAKISELDTYLYQGNLDEANLVANAILDISEKIGDYKAQISVLTFFAHQAYLLKSQNEAASLHNKIQELLENEVLINEIYSYLRKNFNVRIKDDSVLKSLDKHLDYFYKLHKNRCLKVSILSRFSVCYLLNYYRPTEFLTEKYGSLLRNLITDLQRNSTLVFPLLEDIYSKLIYYKLNQSFTNLNDKEDKAEYESLIEHNSHLHFWQNFVNVPELYAIAIKSTFYLSKYHSINHRKDFRETIPSDDIKDIQLLIERCEQMLKFKNWEPNNINNLIHLKLTYAALLMLGNEDQILKGIDTLETLMTVYQQITFSESVDSIFICLLVGYFAKKNYKKCVDTFKRYLKASKGRVVNTENEFEIYTYYYVSQWLSTERPQYLKKLKENFENAGNHQNAFIIQKTMLEMVSYFNLPMSF